jgi:hypothetical protein
MNPFGIIGIIVDLVGVAVIVAGALIPGEARWALIITGVSLSFIGAVMFLIGQKAGRFYGVTPRLLARGQPAFAEVEQLRPTGVIFNNAPVVAFRLKVAHQAHDYPVDVQQATPRRLLDTLLPGSRLAVKVDPERADRVVIDWSQDPTPPRVPPTVVAGESSGPGSVETLRPEQPRSASELLARGRRGTARIMAAKEMGDAVRLGVVAPDDERAGAMMALLDLEVKLPGREPYPVRVVHWVPASQVGKAGPGREVVVAVDRDDPEHQVAIDWETPPT